MNVLLIGGGGREHALAWKMAQSPLLTNLFIAPGNAGTSEIGTNIALNISNFEEVRDFVLSNNIELVIVGPEAPLVDGFHDHFLEDAELCKVPVIGPQTEGAMLEGSKDFAKAFMIRHNIPTAKYETFSKDTLEEGIAFLDQFEAPYVLKADGLAAGKGVLICETKDEAAAELTSMLADGKFGAASEKVVIEEFLKGIEISVFVLTDGSGYKILPSAKDYKRIGEGDTGLNTGGMGCISPVPFADEAFIEKVDERIIAPTIKGLQRDGIPFKGFIFFGLMNMDGEPFVIEYNVRMGDPEAESVLPRIKSDLLRLFIATGKGKLADETIEIDPSYAAAIMMVSGGYPGSYEKGHIIEGIDDVQDSIVFHAGTTTKDGKVVSNGGRVLAVTSLADTLEEAVNKSYESVAKIAFDKHYYRRDLGKDLMSF